MTQDLDALPLPVPTHFRNGVLYAFSADQIRAAHREGYELAKREAQAYFDTLPLIPEGGVPVDVYNEAMQSLAKAVEERDALRKAQEGREPVGVVYTMQALSSLEFDGGPPKCHVSLYEDLPAGTELYAAPPPKSDEARDAERYRWLRRKVCVIGKSTYCGEETGIPIFDFVNLPDVGEVVNRDSASTLDAAIDAALAAQQKGGA